jgi:hypothetical protein
MKIAQWVLFALLGVSSASGAETVPPDVAAFTRQFMTAMQKEGMPGMVPLLHPDAQASMKEQLLTMYRGDGKEELIRRTFGADTKLADIEALPPDQFLARAMARLNADVGDTSKLIQSLDIIGVVRERDTVYVVTRSVGEAMGQKVTSVAVTPLRRHNDQWRAMLTSTIEGTRTPPARVRENSEPPPPPPRLQ